jgi:two-component system, chemotaxis family, sensor kinase Cph1
LACHHREPRRVPFVVRSACELIGRLVSLQAAALAEIDAADQRTALREVEAALVDAMRSDPTGWAEGLASRSDALLRIMNATGAAICDGPRIHRMGAAPTEGEVDGLVGWLSQRGGPARQFGRVAAGLLAIAIPKPTPSYVLWFRQEVPTTVTWSGDPSKPVESGERGRIHPRTSFSVWLEEVRGVSTRWTRAELEMAEDLRRHAVEIDLGRQVARAEEAIRIRDEIVAVVSHDLKNPLALILTATRLIQKGLEPARIRSMVCRIEDAASRMNRLISDLLDLSEIEAGGFAIRASRCDVTELVQDVIALLAPVAEERGIALERIDALEMWVMGDRERLRQVLSNLVGNAIKFTPSAGSIRIDARLENGFVRFAVIDTGPGISRTDQARIFDRYWQEPSRGGRPERGSAFTSQRGSSTPMEDDSGSTAPRVTGARSRSRFRRHDSVARARSPVRRVRVQCRPG